MSALVQERKIYLLLQSLITVRDRTRHRRGQRPATVAAGEEEGGRPRGSDSKQEIYRGQFISYVRGIV